MKKTIKDLFPNLTHIQRCKVGEKANLFGILRSGDKVLEGENKVCQYDESDFKSLEEICKVIEINKND